MRPIGDNKGTDVAETVQARGFGRGMPLDFGKTYSNPCLPKLIYVMHMSEADSLEHALPRVRQRALPSRVR